MKRNAFTLVISSLLLLLPFSAQAELAVGSEGKFKDVTELASSSLHKGALANIQVFLGNLDLHNVLEADSLRLKIVSQLRESASLYQNAANAAGERLLKPVPGSEQDNSEIRFFFDHMKEFGFSGDLSEKSVTASVQRLIVMMASRISDVDVKKLSADIRERQRFFEYVLTSQYFLNTVTTLFRVG